jgi:hypothetical protein
VLQGDGSALAVIIARLERHAQIARGFGSELGAADGIGRDRDRGEQLQAGGLGLEAVALGALFAGLDGRQLGQNVGKPGVRRSIPPGLLTRRLGCVVLGVVALQAFC